jgi:hypothetical protein
MGLLRNILETITGSLTIFRFYCAAGCGTEVSASKDLCPACLERVTAGRISDNDPTTNPDLNKKVS